MKAFSRHEGPLGRPHAVRAVDEVSLAIERGESFGLVGESGSGKTTLARCALRLVEPTSGSITFDGEDVLALAPKPLRAASPAHADGLPGPAFVAGSQDAGRRDRRGTADRPPASASSAQRRARAAELFELVGLDPSHLGRFPHEFSGGQRQRIGIARALALAPSFIAADEPVSALDTSVQAQILNLLMDLQRRLGLTYLLVSHDLRTVRHVCTRVAVMYRGRLVESGPTLNVLDTPRHPYTQALISAVPPLDPTATPFRVAFDASAFAPDAELREVAPAHWAAI